MMMSVSENNLSNPEMNHTLMRFYRWIEKQKNGGTTLTTAYLNRCHPTMQPISRYIKRTDFSNKC
jgi:hypothetical protein